MGIDLQLSLRADISAPRLARRSVHEASTLELPPARREDVALLVSEMVSNSVQHAALEGDDQIRLTIECADGRIRIEVQDDGAGFDCDANFEGSEWGGLGLRIVGRLAQRWGFHGSYPATVWAELSR